MDNRDKMIDDIVAMLDGEMAGGSGHVNVKVDDEGCLQKMVTAGCADISMNPTACSIPTIFLKGDDEM